MFRPLFLIFALMFSDGKPLVQNLPAAEPGKARLLPAYWQGKQEYDVAAERTLATLANQARAQADLAPLRVDDNLTRAARQHARLMAEHGELSHQFPGEPELGPRLAAAGVLHLMEAAENVASAPSAEKAHDGLMKSVMHRDNLLHPSYNAIGVGVARSGDTLYVVQDFSDTTAAYSAEKAEELLQNSVDKARGQGVKLYRKASGKEEACKLARADSLKPSQPQSDTNVKAILRYTANQPDELPDTAVKALQDPGIKYFSASICFATSKTYPSGVYWVVLTLYAPPAKVFGN